MTETATWIVGIDGSDSSRHALHWATTHAAGRATDLHVVTAWQAPLYGPYPVVGPMTSPYDTDALRAAAEREARRLAQEATACVDMPVEAIVVHGGASSSLLEAADHGELLIVGNRGRGGFSRLLLGSTSNQVATHAHVPTVVVRHDAPITTTDRLLVGLDGSPNSLAALEWAIDFASPGSSIDVVWVWDASPLAVGADQFFFPEATDLSRERFEQIVEGVGPRAADASVVLHPEFVKGTPRAALMEFSESADLVVLGARGHGAIGAALLGSVSSWLLHHLHRATVVVPHREPDVPAEDTELPT
ncbi:MAG: universal stress protein [Ilumatobacter sp.]|nr:universal stress protein [Ilumatobacter sp.]